MTNKSIDQYGNQKPTSPKMLMDCIQFAEVIKATHADTCGDRKSSLYSYKKRLRLSPRTSE